MDTDYSSLHTKWMRALVNDCSALLYGQRFFAHEQSLFQCSRTFLMTSGRRQPQDDLETVIDQPLERGQSTNHSNPDRQTVPETFESDIAVDPRHGFSSALAGYDIGQPTVVSR